MKPNKYIEKVILTSDKNRKETKLKFKKLK